MERCRKIANKYYPNSKIIEVRGEDVPEFIEKFLNIGANAVGITGEDLFEEYKLRKTKTSLDVIKRLVWYNENFIYKKPTLCLLGDKDKSKESIPRNPRICINSKYKLLSEKFLKYKNIDYTPIYANGSTEKYYTYGIADLVIDIVCTGKSIEESGLKVYDKIFESDIIIIGRTINDFKLNDLYDKIIKRIQNPDDNSYTQKLIKNPDLLKRKLIEEAAEVITAKNNQELIWESADLLYFLFVIIAKEGVTIEDIEKENKRRNKKSIGLKPEVFFKPQIWINRPKGRGIKPNLSNKESLINEEKFNINNKEAVKK
ncbi:MAG: phosphoribosyl-ATP diphosphatase [Nanoarchaeota archaeon]|nr:phosphoribosyl-ATP diphosphatase [Nanoarchaeota archaeon]